MSTLGFVLFVFFIWIVLICMGYYIGEALHLKDQEDESKHE